MQRNTIFFIAVKALHVSGGFYAYHQELKNWNSSTSTTLAVAATKLNKYQMLYVQFLSS
jgi:hypothetical protein